MDEDLCNKYSMKVIWNKIFYYRLNEKFELTDFSWYCVLSLSTQSFSHSLLQVSTLPVSNPPISSSSNLFYSQKWLSTVSCPRGKPLQQNLTNSKTVFLAHSFRTNYYKQLIKYTEVNEMQKRANSNFAVGEPTCHPLDLIKKDKSGD